VRESWDKRPTEMMRGPEPRRSGSGPLRN
jgi:hypothetical protein